MKLLAFAFTTIVGLMLSYAFFIMSMTGGKEFAYMVGGLLVVAYIAVLVFLIRQDQGGKGSVSSIAMVFPPFLVFGLMFVVTEVIQVGSDLMPDSSSFAAACKVMGPKYKKLPSSPVRSIAYDWVGKHPPPYGMFNVQFGTRLTTMGGAGEASHASIEFSERKRSEYREGRPTKGPDEPYIRIPKAGPYYGIPAFTADVLVRYRMTPEEELEKAEIIQGPVLYEVTVIDRRTEEELASLSYTIDRKKGRACGLTGPNELRQHDFILRALGLGPK